MKKSTIFFSGIVILLHQETATSFALHVVKDGRATVVSSKVSSLLIGSNVNFGPLNPRTISNNSSVNPSALQMRLFGGKDRGGSKEKNWVCRIGSIQNWIRARGILGGKRVEQSRKNDRVLKTREELHHIRQASRHASGHKRMESLNVLRKKLGMRSLLPFLLTMLLTVSSVPRRALAMAVGGASAPLQPLSR